MTPFIRKLEALLQPDEDGVHPHPETVGLINAALVMEKLRTHLCTVCLQYSTEGADEEGDMGWWCLDCMEKWEVANGCHWEDGTPLKP